MIDVLKMMIGNSPSSLSFRNEQGRLPLLMVTYYRLQYVFFQAEMGVKYKEEGENRHGGFC
jgi:hypothetical protein